MSATTCDNPKCTCSPCTCGADCSCGQTSGCDNPDCTCAQCSCGPDCACGTN